MKRRNFIGGILSVIGLGVVGNKAQATDNQILPIKSNEDEFYLFFYRFNGFPINDNQKMFYDWYKKDYKMMTMGRETGTTVFLITLAAFQAFKGRVVSYYTFCHHHANYCNQVYNKNMDKYSNLTSEKAFTNYITPLFMVCGGEGRRTDLALFDNYSYSGYDAFSFTKKCMIDYYKHKKVDMFSLDTFEFKPPYFV